MENKLIITSKKIENQIYTVRGQQVMFDSDLASIYQVETKVFNQAVNVMQIVSLKAFVSNWYRRNLMPST